MLFDPLCCCDVVFLPLQRAPGNSGPWRDEKETLFILSQNKARDCDPALHLAPVWHAKYAPFEDLTQTHTHADLIQHPKMSPSINS